MLKLTSLLLFVVMFTTATMQAQTLPAPAQQQESQTNLRQVFSKETNKLKSESSTLDAKKLEKNARRDNRGGMSKTKTKWIIALAIIGVVVAVVIGIKYTKRCIRREPRGCDFTDTTRTCECLEYEQDDD